MSMGDIHANSPRCPMCDGQGGLLGTLGSRRWYRCRFCGIDFSKQVRRRANVRGAPRKDHPLSEEESRVAQAALNSLQGDRG
jgi:tRNA(Ile2) C34 agmatinyltransferase TiaS